MPRHLGKRHLVTLGAAAVVLLAPQGASGQGASSQGAETTLSGTVTTVDGSAVHQARVDLLPLLPPFEAGRSLLQGAAAPAPVASATTDRHGRFRLAAPRSGVWKVLVRAHGFVPIAYSPLVLTEPVELSPALLRPDAGAALRVVDPTGVPRAGAGVFALSSPGETGLRRDRGWKVELRLGRTDGDGRLTLPRLAGEKLEVTVLAPGLAPQSRSRLEGGEVRLAAPAAQRRIEVRDPRGEPLAGVLARIGELRLPAGLSGPDGRLALPSSLDGSLQVQLSSQRGQRRFESLPAVAGDAPGPWIVELAEPIALAGRVIDAASRRPLRGALVWSSAAPASFARSDAQGRYRLILPADQRRFWLQAEAAGRLPQAIPIEREHLVARRAPTLALAPWTALHGEVVDSLGRPLPGAALEAVAERRGRRPFRRPDPADGRAVSGQEGRFELAGLAAGESYVLRAARAGFSAATVRAVAPAGRRNATRIRLQLAPARAAFGRLVDADDQPVAGAEVILAVSGSPRPLRSPRPQDAADDPTRGLSDEHGRFELGSVPAQTVDITVLSDAYLPMTVRGIEVAAGDGAVDLGTLVLVSGASLAGRVVDVDGEGVADAAVYLLGAIRAPESLGDAVWKRLAGGTPAATSDAGGRFQITGLEAGERKHLAAEHPDYALGWLKGAVAPSAQPLLITLEAGLRVSGQVVDEAGEPVAEAEVRLELPVTQQEPGLPPPRPTNRLARSDADGRFEISGLRAGSATLHVSARGFVAPEIALAIPEETASPLRVVLERGAELAGRIATSDGEPVAEVRLLTDQQRSVSDADGLYRLTGLPLGALRLEVRHPHYENQIRTVEIEPGVNRLDLTFETGEEVSGRVVDEEGQPVAEARVALVLDLGRSFRLYRAVSAEDGAFELADVADGTYRLRAEKPGFAPREIAAALTVAAEAVNDLEVVLEPAAVVSGRVLGLDFDELARVDVEAEGENGSVVKGRVDYQGHYEVRDLATGSWLVRATLAGGRRQAQARVAPQRGRRQISRDLEFDARLRLSGRVLHDGAPIEGTIVSLRGYEVAVRRSVTTDHLGEFLIEDLLEGAYHLGLSNAREFLVHNQELRLSGDEEIEIDLRPARVSGRVIEEGGGGPIGDALVSLRRLAGRGGEGVLGVGSEADGAFYFPRVPPGRYRLVVRKDGYSAAEQELELASGSEVSDLEVAARATEGLTLGVRLASGEVPAYVTAAILDASGRLVLEESRQVDAQAVVRFPRVAAGDWQLLLSAPGTVTETATVSVPGEPVPIVLAAAGRLAVRVPTLSTSDRVATLQLLGTDERPFRILDPAQGLLEQWTLVGGRTRIDGVPGGVWAMRATAADGQVYRGNATVVPGVEIEVVLE